MSSEQPGAGLRDNDAEMRHGPFGRWVAKAIRNPGRVYRAMFYVATMFFLFMALFPSYWLLITALAPSRPISDMGPLPKRFNPEVFITMFERVPFHLYMFNSFVLGIATTVIVLLLASLMEYVFGRLRFPGKGVLMLDILAISYFPPAAFLIPLFELFTGNTAINLGAITISSSDLFNTLAPMVFPFNALFLPLSIFILTTFYGQILDGLEDAVRVEGTTRFGALFRVIVPLSAPDVATAGVLTFISVYNEFFFSFIMNDGEADSWAPIVAGILKHQRQFDTPYNLITAALIVGVLPVAILVIIIQKRTVSGLITKALKK